MTNGPTNGPTDGRTDGRTQVQPEGIKGRWEIICQGKLCKAFGLKKTQRLQTENCKTVAMATIVAGSSQKLNEVQIVLG